MPIYEENKMMQKVVYPTKQTPSYADWALFEMGKELEANGSVFDPAQDIVFRTATGINPEFKALIEITISDNTPVAVKFNNDTYTLNSIIGVTDKYEIKDSDTLVGFLLIFDGVSVDKYVGANLEFSGHRRLYYGLITSVNESE